MEERCFPIKRRCLAAVGAETEAYTSEYAEQTKIKIPVQENIKELIYSGKIVQGQAVTAKAEGGGPRLKMTPTNASHFPAGTVEANESTPDKLKRFDCQILAFMKEQKIPGVSLVIAKKGNILHTQCYGWASNSTRVGPHHLFRTASISKVLTAVAVMKLYEDGRIGLKDRVFGPKGLLKSYSPPSGILDRRVLRITVTHLLQHSAGWDRDVVGDPCFWKHVGREMAVPEPVDPPTLIRYMLEREKLQFNPGSKYVYSNLGYLVLGRVIEQVTGQSYEVHVQQVLAQADIVGVKLGKTRKEDADPDEVEYFPWPQHIRVDSVYPGEGKVPSPYGSYAMESGDADGGWLATPLHLVKLFQSLEENTVLMASTFKKMLEKPNYAKGSSAWYGLGLDVAWNKKAWEHGGHIDGATGVVTRDRHGYTWAFLANYWPSDSDYTSLLSYAISGVEGWSDSRKFHAVLKDTATMDAKFIVKVKLQHHELGDVLSNLQSQGYSLTWINAYHVEGQTFFNVICKNEGESQRTIYHLDMDRETLSSVVTTQAGHGYVPVFVDSYLLEKQLRFAVILSKDCTTQSVLLEDLTVAELALKTKELKEDNFVPKCQSMVCSEGVVRTCVLYVKGNAAKSWPQFGKTLKQLEGELKKQARYGHLLSYVKAYDEAYGETGDNEVKFSLIWTDPGPYKYTIEYDMSQYRLLNDVLYVSELNFSPACVCGYEGSEDEVQKMHKFAAVCVKQVPPGSG